MGFLRGILMLTACALGWAIFRVPAPAEDAANSKTADRPVFSKQVGPLLAQYCVRCHGGTKPKAGLALDNYKDDAAALRAREVWERVGPLVRAHEMPPAKQPQPTQAETQLIIAWIDSVTSADTCIGQKDPGRVTLRRLNRAEYNNTVRDLVGVKFQPADDFPADDVGYGFDNIGDVLSLPPLLLEKYLAAAERIVTSALATPDLRTRIMICTPTLATKDECARKILEAFARRAYRRPPTSGEVDRLAKFVRLAESQGDSFDKGIELALEAILTSPNFLFLVERDPTPARAGGPPRISQHELATRLSYFLWSSMPDGELFQQAGKATLNKDGNLENQIRRMLNDPKSRALVDNFAGQWLQLRNLKSFTPDPKRFPSFDESLRAAMLQETEEFFASVIREDRSILDFLDADFTFVNERLAKHYGIPGIHGSRFQRVALTGDQRGGILSQASILAETSNPTRTSPVKRGKWVLENILGTPPPPPPPGAGALNESKASDPSASLRKLMEQHRANPDCASCHARMDPLGFGLENYDAIGAWRDREGGSPIDASGVLPGGQTFNGPRQLKAILMSKQGAFARCLAEKMLTYALGRGLEHYDRCAVDKICDQVARDHYKFSSLVVAIVQSDPFQMRRSKEGQ
ncbi:MAG TPA: DUF1592 domain-containing protein [Gemmataceae bacterium]|nr:DUF1592 domain-containing protein [Gemmataceae bacterium]